MENLPTELFLARIPRPAVCQNEEGNIISLPSVLPFARCHPYPPPPSVRRLSPSPSPPTVPFVVNREFEL